MAPPLNGQDWCKARKGQKGWTFASHPKGVREKTVCFGKRHRQPLQGTQQNHQSPSFVHYRFFRERHYPQY